jgi:pimeloyl-ACP methyl ester carboxylesterase
LKTKNRNRIRAKATSLTVLLVSVLILSTLTGAQFIGKVSAIEYTQYNGTLNGADWVLRIPDPWNGMLVVICRGYWGPAIIPDPMSTISYGSYMLEQEFAVAASNYGSAGFCIQAGVDSTYELTMHVIDNYEVTGKVFLYGMSMGGAVALLLGEKYPEVYSGVLDLFGAKDLKEQYTTKSRWANLNDEELTAELTALDIPVPPPGLTLEEIRTRCASNVIDYELETGGTPETHPQAYEDRSPTYHANITIPVITIHGTGDAIVPFYESVMYQDEVANAGSSHLYRLYNVTDAGHGNTGGSAIYEQAPDRFDELTAWSDVIPEGLTFGVMLLISTVATIVSISILRKRPKWKKR